MLLWLPQTAIVMAAVSFNMGASAGLEAWNPMNSSDQPLQSHPSAMNNSPRSYNFAEGVVQNNHPNTQFDRNIFAQGVWDGYGVISSSPGTVNHSPIASSVADPPAPLSFQSQQSAYTSVAAADNGQSCDNNNFSSTQLIAIGTAAVAIPAVFLLSLRSMKKLTPPVMRLGAEQSVAPIMNVDEDDDDKGEDPGMFSEDEAAFNSKFETGNDASLWTSNSRTGFSAW